MKDKLFVGYLTAGQRSLAFTKQAALALVNNGVNVLEIGVPFTDPVADGAVIQQAMEEALLQGVNFSAVLGMIKELRQLTTAKIILFSYYNPILVNSLKHGYQQIKQAGVDGLLIVDLPLEESEQHFHLCQEVDLEPIAIVSPTTKNERIDLLNRSGKGFIYYACRNGITGERASLPGDIQIKLKNLRVRSNKPVVAGFGISTREQAQIVLNHADGFVVGSHFIKAISDGATAIELGQLVKYLDPNEVRL